MDVEVFPSRILGIPQNCAGMVITRWLGLVLQRFLLSVVPTQAPESDSALCESERPSLFSEALLDPLFVLIMIMTVAAA